MIVAVLFVDSSGFVVGFNVFVVEGTEAQRVDPSGT